MSTETEEKIALLRTIVGHSEGREERALAECEAVLAGATIEDLQRARAEVAS